MAVATIPRQPLRQHQTMMGQTQIRSFNYTIAQRKAVRTEKEGVTDGDVFQEWEYYTMENSIEKKKSEANDK